MPDENIYDEYMSHALMLAREAAAAGEVPVGAVIVKDGQIIAAERNRVEELKDPTCHAELLAIRAGLKAVGGWRLADCDLYVTLEPCAMCAGAVIHARLRRVIIGTLDPKAGACGSVLDIPSEKRLNHHPEIITGVMQEECSTLLKDFFKELRRKDKHEKNC